MIRFLRVCLALLLSAALLFALAGCGARGGEAAVSTPLPTQSPMQAQSKVQPASDRITVGVSLLDGDNRFIQDIENAMIQRANELGVELLMMDGRNSPEKQVNQVQTLISKMVDVIILNPSSLDGCKSAVDAANLAGIPILTVNTRVANQEKCVAFIGSQAEEAGRLQMECAARELGGKGAILYLDGQLGQEAQIGRKAGAQEVLAKYPDLKIVYEQSGNWSRAEGYAITENFLRLSKSIDAIVSQNDEMALGAIEAIEDTGFSSRVKVFGTDALPEALNAVVSGKMSATVFQDGKQQGILAVNIAKAIAEGESVKKAYYIPYELVTAQDAPKYQK